MEASIRPPKSSRPMAGLLKITGITLSSAGENTFRAFQAFIMASDKWQLEEIVGVCLILDMDL